MLDLLGVLLSCCSGFIHSFIHSFIQDSFIRSFIRSVCSLQSVRTSCYFCLAPSLNVIALEGLTLHGTLFSGNCSLVRIGQNGPKFRLFLFFLLTWWYKTIKGIQRMERKCFLNRKGLIFWKKCHLENIWGFVPKLGPN